MRIQSVFHVLSLALACSAASATDLSIKLSGLPSDKGKILVAAYNSEAAYKGKGAVAKARIPANGERQVVFRNLPAGRYAISAFHDENDNGSLDKNALGIPSEAYGFSRNPATRFGPPSFGEASFPIEGSRVELEIILE